MESKLLILEEVEEKNLIRFWAGGLTTIQHITEPPFLSWDVSIRVGALVSYLGVPILTSGNGLVEHGLKDINLYTLIKYHVIRKPYLQNWN